MGSLKGIGSTSRRAAPSLRSGATALRHLSRRLQHPDTRGRIGDRDHQELVPWHLRPGQHHHRQRRRHHDLRKLCQRHLPEWHRQRGHPFGQHRYVGEQLKWHLCRLGGRRDGSQQRHHRLGRVDFDAGGPGLWRLARRLQHPLYRGGRACRDGGRECLRRLGRQQHDDLQRQHHHHHLRRQLPRHHPRRFGQHDLPGRCHHHERRPRLRCLFRRCNRCRHAEDHCHACR